MRLRKIVGEFEIRASLFSTASMKATPSPAERCPYHAKFSRRSVSAADETISRELTVCGAGGLSLQTTERLRSGWHHSAPDLHSKSVCAIQGSEAGLRWRRFDPTALPPTEVSPLE